MSNGQYLDGSSGRIALVLFACIGLNKFSIYTG